MSKVQQLALYASRSCAPKEWSLLTFAAALSKCRLQGIHFSLLDLGRDDAEHRESADVIKQAGLRLVVDISSLLPITKRSEHGNIVDHIQTFELHLTAIGALGDVVTHINCCHSGYHFLDITTAAEYLGNILPLSAQFFEEHPYIGQYGWEVDIMGGSPNHLTGISHQTGVGILKFPEQTCELLEILPPLYLTMGTDDFDRQNLVFGDTRTLSSFEAEFVPHLDHIIADASANNNELLWKQVWSRKATRNVEEMSVTLDLHRAIDILGCAEDGESLAPEVLELAATTQRSFGDLTIEWQ